MGEQQERVAGVEGATPEPRPWWRKRISPLWGLLVIALAGVLFCGNFHLVHGEGHDLVIVRKSSFTLSESFVSWDEILGVPRIIAISRNPLTVKALEREGLIRTEVGHDPPAAPSTDSSPERDRIATLRSDSAERCRVLKVDTPSYYGKPQRLVVQAKLDDYYNYKYRNKQETHYSIRFTCGELRGSAYAARKKFKDLFDFLDGAGGSAVLEVTVVTDRSHESNDIFTVKAWRSAEDAANGVDE
jgi:hypothetical protein